MCENALLRAKVPRIVCGARSFKYINKVTFDPSHLRKIGPTMQEECREIYVRWLKRRGLDIILKYEEPG
jgi:hypothetical protein